ncbi:hypothetical protein ACVWYQ_003111 [Bradyrhizobium sp. USDA 3397]
MMNNDFRTEAAYPVDVVPTVAAGILSRAVIGEQRERPSGGTNGILDGLAVAARRSPGSRSSIEQ